MRELVGEPVQSAESVYRTYRPPPKRASWKCWRYYHESDFWSDRLR